MGYEEELTLINRLQGGDGDWEGKNKKTQDYVLGFLFDYNQRVVLIFKKRPAWQYNLFNGVGGHVEPNEDPLDAMTREFQEETGVYFSNWNHYATLSGSDFNVKVYRGFASPGLVSQCQTMTDEEVHILDLRPGVYSCSVQNLSWLIPAALVNAGEKIECVYGD